MEKSTKKDPVGQNIEWGSYPLNFTLSTSITCFIFDSGYYILGNIELMSQSSLKLTHQFVVLKMLVLFFVPFRLMGKETLWSEMSCELSV